MAMMKIGPVGDSVGEPWEERSSERISHIFLSFDDRYLLSIQFGYVKNGVILMSKLKKYGSSKPNASTRIVRLNHVSEFVTGISGVRLRFGTITSLTFHTNQTTHEAFRAEDMGVNGMHREFHSGIRDRREFAGFLGTCYDSRIVLIGLHIKPILPSVPAVGYGRGAVSFSLR